MAKETVHAKKPAKGLFHHKGSGQWAAKIRGKSKYFGSVKKDPDGVEALRRYSDALAGRTPCAPDALTVVQLVDAFERSKHRKVESGELSARTFSGYRDVCDVVIRILGADRPVAGVRPADFEALRSELAKTHGPVRLCTEITCVKMILRYGYDAELIEKPVRFGPEFKKPSRLVLRKHRQQVGPRMFSAVEIRAMLDSASPQLRAMIYLGVNCGLGNNDCALLTTGALDLKAGWLDFPRPKTAVPRRCPLWPETVRAIEAAMVKRPTPKDPSHADLVFVTKYGAPWEPKPDSSDSPISKETAKVLRELGIHRKGTGFYALRHTFQTIGEKARDAKAVSAIMGHAEKASDMSAVYSEERVDDERLLAVTEYVRHWLSEKSKSA